MQFSDTTNKQGLLQDCEFWTGFGDGVITGDATLKATFTRLMNVKNAEVQAELQLLTGSSAGFEDTNYSDEQFSFFDIENGEHAHQFLTDADGNTISDITGVLILPSATSTEFVKLDKLTADTPKAEFVMSPNPSNVGIPSAYLEKNNTIYFDTVPNYEKAAGGKLFYRLVPSYFVPGDTTKKPGFAEGYHSILSVGGSLKWLLVNKPEATLLITAATRELADLRAGLKAYTKQRNPVRRRVTGARNKAI
jgi:hypothetical protein